jgi:hypothetical protein
MLHFMVQIYIIILFFVIKHTIELQTQAFFYLELCVIIWNLKKNKKKVY